MQNSSVDRMPGLLELTEIRAPPPPTQFGSSKKSEETLHKLQPIIGSRVSLKCLVPSDLQYIRKKKPKMLSSVQITRLSSQNIGMRGTETLRRALVDGKRISSLSFNQEPKDTQNAEHLVRIINSSNQFKKLKCCYHEKTRVLRSETVKSLTRLRRCRNISDLAIDLKCNELTKNEVVHHLSTQFKGLSKLESLSLDVTNFSNQAILPLKTPKSLKSVSLDFRGKSLASHPISILLPIIQNSKSLEHIHLNSYGFSNIEPQEAQIWVHLFEKTQNLKTLSVRKDFDYGQQLEAIKIFFDGFQHLKHLKVLAFRFTFNFDEQNSETFADFFYDCLSASLACLTELEELQLDFLNDLNITDLRLPSLARALQKCKSLKKLKLTLPSEKISDKGMIPFAKSLEKLANLEVLLINFSSTTIGFEAMKILSDKISRLPLTSFSLAINPEKTHDILTQLTNYLLAKNISISLFSGISDLKFLSTLEMNLAKFDISTANYRQFSLALKDLKFLKSLSLQLPQSDMKEKYEGFQSFLSVLNKLPSLLSLYLTFSGKELCNQEVRLLSESLKDCKSLEILEICFEQAQNLTEESLSHLKFGIQGLSSMKNLKLEFLRNGPLKNAVPFNSDSVIELLRTFTVLKRLETLKFSEDFEGPNAATLPLYLKGYENLRNLQSFVVNKSRYV